MIQKLSEIIYKIRMRGRKDWDGHVWHSWDLHPWEHPWLTPENLKKEREFSLEFLEKEKNNYVPSQKISIAFAGNIANCMYVRALPLRKMGENVDIFVHDQDQYIMSFPSWEHFDGILPETLEITKDCISEAIELPEVEGVYQVPSVQEWQKYIDEHECDFIRSSDVQEFSSYFSNIPCIEKLNQYDVTWGTQSVYLSYLANKPYIASQSGGDMWLESSRNDMLGAIQRRAFTNARVIPVSNPWSYANARRLGLKNLIFLPKILDEDLYKPGANDIRQEWEGKSGGKFFVLTSSRLDEKNKGSSIGFRGFAEFSKQNVDARLVLIGWGNDIEKKKIELEELGILDKIILLPMSGKALLRKYLQSADIFMDQFVLGYYGSAGMEAMACGLPVIGYYKSEQYQALYGSDKPPFFSTRSPRQVAIILQDLYESPDKLKETSQAHRDWFLKGHGSERWKEHYQNVLKATAAGAQADFSRSSLSLPLTFAEKKYHAQGLMAAPPHPHYKW